MLCQHKTPLGQAEWGTVSFERPSISLMPPKFSNLPPALVNYSVIRTTSHSWKFVAERGFRLGRGMRWGTWIHSEGPKGRHDRLGIPSQDPRNNLENKTKGHCTNLMIAQVCYVETSHQKNMTLEEKKIFKRWDWERRRFSLAILDLCTLLMASKKGGT